MKHLKREIIARELDKNITALKATHELTKSRPSRGWLRAVRDALGLSQSAVAAKAGIKQQSLIKLEVRESKGTITLESLERAAGAMSCNVVYYLVPKPEIAGSFADLAAHFDPDGRQWRAAMHSMALEGQAVKPRPGQNP